MNKFPTIEQTDQLKDYQKQIAHRRLPVPHPDVAFSGTAGSHTEDAAMSFFGESAHFISHASFEDVFKSITGGGAHYGVLPIENSSTGAIAAVYDLLSEYRCFIVGEEKRGIIQCLMAAEGASLDTLQEIYSHPQGFQQSGRFLEGYPQWTCIPWHNTAVAAKMVSEAKNPAYGAIASPRAAQIHHLNILAEGINTATQNTTRFVIVAAQMENRPNQDKMSIAFHLPHYTGALYTVLGIFERHHLNLCKIESRPIPDANWEYQFFLDFLGAEDSATVDDAIAELIQGTVRFRFLGRYASKK